MMQNNEKKINNDESCECGKINYDCSKNNKIVELWINDPSVFFDKKNLLEVWPNENMDREEKINTISRLVIYMTFFGMLIFNNIKLLITGIITLGILIVVYYVLKKKNNEFLEKSLKETFSNEALYEKYKHNFTNPMTKNPLMNVSLPEINDNPHRLTAAPAYNKAVEEKINNSVQDIVKNNFKDPKIADKLFKNTNKLTALQIDRWIEILKTRKERANNIGLDNNMIVEIFELIHKYSIFTQTNIMREE